MGGPLSRFPTVAPVLGPAQDPSLSLARRDPPSVEVLEERDGVLPGDAEKVLDVAGADLLLLSQEDHDLVLDRRERLGVEEERLLDAQELLAVHEDGEELVLLVAGDADARQPFPGARRRPP